MPISVTLLVHTLDTGAVARAQALSVVFEALGHRVRVVSTRGRQLWAPVRGTPFAATCQLLSWRSLAQVVARDTDLLVPVKVLPGSLGIALALALRHHVPLLVDVDDPEVEVRTTWAPPHQVARALVRHPVAFAALRLLRSVARRLPTIVTTPVLQGIYGGELVPHARVDPGAGAPHTRTGPVLGFVGTVREHKGVDDLRAAVERLSCQGWRLVVTADLPPDARPWESWVGACVPDSRALLASVDVVVIPSTPQGYGRAQLPLKLVDAMLAGRAVVVSDTGPLRWAAGPDAPSFPAGDVDALVRALTPLGDPGLRTAVGDRLRCAALARYTPAAVAPALQRAVDTALATTRAPRGRARPTHAGRA